MTDMLSHHQSTSVPSSPVLSHKQIHLSGKTDAAQAMDPIEQLREQLQAAKIPVTKRASITEVPTSADDCQLLPGTTRCSLTLCEDSCTTRHSHHRTHAKPLAADAPLIYSRPSISMGTQGLASFASPAESPADSAPPSRNTSPQQVYRRASAFGFNFGAGGSNRGSVVGSQLMMSGFQTPADAFSGPPSPLSEGSSAHSSAQVSPRQAETVGLTQQRGIVMAPLMEEPACAPIAEESKLEAALPAPAVAAAPSSSSSQQLVNGHPIDTEYWRLRNHIVNLSDYRTGVAGIGSEEARTRTDLAAAPREDFADQEHPAWDPRSPQPPSPVEMGAAEVLQVNMNQHDRTKPEIEYIIRPTHGH